MADFPRVKVVNSNDGWIGTEYYIDGKKIDEVKSVDFRVAVDEAPSFTFETFGLPDIEMSAIPKFNFTPQTVQEATKVLQNEFRTNPASQKALVDSIASVLKEIPDKEEFWVSDLAGTIANRIIGIG